MAEKSVAEYKLSNRWIWVGSLLPVLGMSQLIQAVDWKNLDWLSWLLIAFLLLITPFLALFYRGKVRLTMTELVIERMLLGFTSSTVIPVGQLKGAELSGRKNGHSINILTKSGKTYGLFLSGPAQPLFYQSLLLATSSDSPPDPT